MRTRCNNLDSVVKFTVEFMFCEYLYGTNGCANVPLLRLTHLAVTVFYLGLPYHYCILDHHRLYVISVLVAR